MADKKQKKRKIKFINFYLLLNVVNIPHLLCIRLLHLQVPIVPQHPYEDITRNNDGDELCSQIVVSSAIEEGDEAGSSGL